jgi:hypothetical protein
MSDVIDALAAHCGGEGNLTEPQRLIARRAAALEAELVHLESKFGTLRAAGEEPDAADLDLYGRLANGQRRHLEAIGLRRVPREVEGIVELMAREAEKNAIRRDAEDAA